MENFEGASLDFLEQEAIEFIQQHEPKEGYFVGFSGGKDSVATLHLCKLAGVKFEVWYTCTRIDPPEIYKFIRENYPEVKWAYPKITFWEGIRKKAPPLRMQRWCCEYLKKKPTKKIPLHHRIMGLRAKESARRSSRPRINPEPRSKNIIYKPIFYWEEHHVWEFIRKYKLPFSSLYNEGFHRIGCIICPYHLGKSNWKVNERTRSMERYPEQWKIFRKVVEEWWNIKRKDRDWEKYKSAEEFYEAYLNHFEE